MLRARALTFIDVADGTFWIDLGMVNNGYVDVTFNWENVTPPPPPAPLTTPSLIQRGAMKIAAFAITTGGAVQYREKASIGSAWGTWVNLGGSGNDFIRALPINNGGMAVFSCGGGGAFYRYLASESTGVWGSWIDLSGSGLKRVIPVQKTDGKLAAVVCGTQSSVFYKEQTSAGPAAAWDSWIDLDASGISELDA